MRTENRCEDRPSIETSAARAASAGFDFEGGDSFCPHMTPMNADGKDADRRLNQVAVACLFSVFHLRPSASSADDSSSDRRHLDRPVEIRDHGRPWQRGAYLTRVM